MSRLLILSCLLLFLSTCKKEMPDCPCTEDESLQNLYDWLYFEDGTYWIYEEENSGALDTVTVYENWLGVSSGGYDSFLWNSYSSFFDYDFKYSFNDSFSRKCATRIDCTCRKVTRTKVRPGDFVGSDQVFRTPMVVGNYAYLLGGGRVDLTNRIDSLTILDNHFFNVMKHEVDDDNSEGNEQVNYFLSKHFGIIRKELVDQNQIWNLKEYNINQ